MNLPYFSPEDVHAALDWRALVEALRIAFAEGCEVPLRHSHAVTAEGDKLLLMPAWRAGQALGVKLVTVFPGNRARGVSTVAALFVLLDGRTGHPLALVDGESLTLRRTAAASALAAGYLARKDSRRLLLVGTGALAPFLAQAHCALLDMDEVRVWGRSIERAEALASQLRADGLPAIAEPDLEHALAHADIVSCATTATEPVLRGEWVRPGTHVDLVGGFTPQMREADDALVARSAVFVDTYAGALQEAGDLTQPLANGVLARSGVLAELGELARNTHAGRASAQQITLFKSVGSALEDLCAAQLVLARSPMFDK